jgi:hypothetical protein
MSRAFTRAEIEAMRPDELAANADAISAWAAAGAVDGQAPMPLKRPEGHQFTRAEVEAISRRPEEFEANRDAVNAWLAEGTA